MLTLVNITQIMLFDELKASKMTKICKKKKICKVCRCMLIDTQVDHVT